MRRPKAKVASWTTRIHKFCRAAQPGAGLVLIDSRHGITDVDSDVLTTLESRRQLSGRADQFRSCKTAELEARTEPPRRRWQSIQRRFRNCG